jgi:hypothetical protein
LEALGWSTPCRYRLQKRSGPLPLDRASSAGASKGATEETSCVRGISIHQGHRGLIAKPPALWLTRSAMTVCGEERLVS